jgi:nicotinamidase/pyrazinamidase
MSESDEGPTILLIIDPQVDFHEGGALAVPGATSDSARIAEFIKGNGHKVDEILVTLDSHYKIHIAHGIFWTSESNETPAPFSSIKAADIESGKWVPKDSSRTVGSFIYLFINLFIYLFIFILLLG